MSNSMISVLALSAAISFGCSASEEQCTTCPASGAGCMTELQDVEFSGEEKITILGYDKNGMEVDITADGEVLMFNDRVKDGPPNKNIHWASRIDDKTYQYEGEVTEINTDEVDGTPSFDAGGNVYFTSLGSYFPAPGNTDAFKSIYKGSFDGRNVTNVSIVENLYVG